MYLLADQYRYWFTQEEIKKQNIRNKAFEADCIEEQLIMKYYRVPDDGETGVLLSPAEILEKINGGIKKPLSTSVVGSMMKKLRFEKVYIKGNRKYRVIELQYDDIQRIRKEEAIDTDDRPL